MVTSRCFQAKCFSWRFFNQIGGAIGTAGEYSNGAAGPVNLQLWEIWKFILFKLHNEQIIANTEVMVLWGADLYKTNRVGYSVANHRCFDAYEEYKKAGMKVILIDPIYNTSVKNSMLIGLKLDQVQMLL